MSVDSAPFARIECYLSPAGIRDAIRKGMWSSETATHHLDPNGELWDQFFGLEPDIEFGESRFDEEPVAVGAVLIVGRPLEVRFLNESPDVMDIDWEYGEAWQMPKRALVIGDPSNARRFDTYLTASELLKYESTARQTTLSESEASFDRLLDSWRTWVGEHGAKDVEWVLSSAQSIDRDFVNTQRASDLDDVVVALTRSFEEYEKAKTEDVIKAELMQCLVASSEVIAAVAAESKERAGKTREMEDAKLWASEYGSTRLQKAIQLGLLPKAMGVYRDERRHAERPGWSWMPRNEEFKDIVNPNEADLDALAIARTIDATSQLKYRSNDRSVWITGFFLSRRVMIRASHVLNPPEPHVYAFDEEPF